jgi:hypothetical protein
MPEEFMDWWPFDEGILIADEEAEERHSERDNDTFTMNPDEGFEEDYDDGIRFWK